MAGKGDAPAPREPEEEEDAGGVVKLISAERFEFVVDKKAAMVSNTLKNMLTSPGLFINFKLILNPEISTAIWSYGLPIVMRVCPNLLVVSMTWDKPVSIEPEPEILNA
ncbi:hypothetical protein BAE44_0013025 [Dichanthelium oligosanthes]|uniref:SKP1 component POZ domain-containing protein n=1 Tax=Dichanthelium oligosanthes TaxID=888268 RepID=A0A1E5VLE9_9POAL|nr:hypothetical protein BAE44_0013025 [Dichanthelium oligosanthes]